MLNRIVAKGAAIGLLLVLPRTILPAQTPASRPAPAQTGVIYPQSGVTLKGNPVITSTAVYSGDPIQTRELATLLTGDGVSMLLKPHTSLVFGKVVELGCGGLVLVTGKAIAVRFAGIAVVPSGNPGKLEIDNAGGIITVIVRSGTASLNQGGQVSQLQEGRSISRPSSERCPVAVAGGARTLPPATSSSLLGGSHLYWIVGGAGAAGVVAGVLATRGEKRISPSTP